MKKLLPYETPTVHYFEVVFIDPDNSYPNSVICNVYSYINDMDIIAAIINDCTKYEYTLQYVGTSATLPPSKHLSLNQLVTFLKRLRFYTKREVKKQRVITYTEVVTEEL